MNGIFYTIILVAFLTAGYRQATWVAPTPDAIEPMAALSTAVVESAGNAVTLAIGLVGVMALFLGLMKVAEAGGMLVVIAKVLRPLMIRAFPDVPPEHPAMGAMILNFSANVLGLANAATPFGIRAMQELDTLNPHRGTATNAMALFLALNTSSLTLLPTGVIALRAAAGSNDPAGILPTTLFATACSTSVALVAAKLYQRWSGSGGQAADEPLAVPATVRDSAPPNTAAGVLAPQHDVPDNAYPVWASVVTLSTIVALVPLTVIYGRAVSPWVVPGLIVGLLTFGLLRKVRVYEVLVDGARDGFQVAIKIIPYLVAILVAVAMFRASGALDLLVAMLGPVTTRVGLPAEALPMALLRPLSGSGAYGILASIIQDPATGPDSYTGYLVSTLQGSTETTFYVLAVYFGAVQVTRTRHTMAAALTADVAGIAGAVVACRLLYAG